MEAFLPVQTDGLGLPVAWRAPAPILETEMKSMTSTFSFLPWRRAAIGLTFMGMLAGCAGPSVQEYTQERPELDLRQYFNGPLTAHGLFTDRSEKWSSASLCA
jgi:hypothetical protein